MSLYDPYSHTRLFELRQDQLARKARHREKAGLAAIDPQLPTRQILRALQARLTGRSATVSSRPSGRPALDS